MTGCEKMIYNERKKEEREAKKAEKDLAKSQTKSKKHKTKKSVLAAKASKVQKSSATKKKRAKPKVPKPNPTRANYLNTLGGLMPGNVYDDANANLGKRQLPTSSATRKKEALAGLLAGIDNDDLPSAQREKNRLDRSMKTLGKYRVRSDGEGRWRLRGDQLDSFLIAERFLANVHRHDMLFTSLPGTRVGIHGKSLFSHCASTQY